MKTKDLTLAALLLALLIVCSQLVVPLGPIPLTLQSFAILLIGFLLSPKNTFLVTLTYLVGGFIGLPFFSGFQGGLQIFLRPSFGFIIAFVPAAYLQAKYLARIQTLRTTHLMTAGIINLAVTYLLGLTYMAFILTVYLNRPFTLIGILMAGLIPFIPGDSLKLVLSIVVVKRIGPLIRQKR